VVVVQDYHHKQQVVLELLAKELMVGITTSQQPLGVLVVVVQLVQE
jgi:hypothetical protein